MKPKQFALATALAGASIAAPAAAKEYIELVNPKATPEAVKLYHFLQDIGGRYTLSGQHNFCGKGSEFTEQLEEIIGKTPVVWGADFSFTVKGDNAADFQHAGPANLPVIPRESYDAIRKSWTTGAPPPEKKDVPLLDITIEQARAGTIAEAKKRHARGQIITLMWHGCFPADAYPCNGNSVWAEGHLPSDEEWDQLCTPGTPLNDAWAREVDKVAGYLKELQDAHIPVLWRPYHEMNGEWFWWGHKKGEQGFKRLWLMMYDRYTNHHGLNNLIWVWDPNSPRAEETGDKRISYADYFPGVEHVDALATDIYRGFAPSHYTELVALAGGKPVAIGECGKLPSVDELAQQPGFTWFMPWGWILFLANEPDAIRELYNSDRVLTLDEIAVDKSGVYSVKPPSVRASE